MRLPEKFTAEMKSLLADEWVPFYQAWEEGLPYQALRVNTLKISCADFLARTGFALKPVPWTTDGFYLCGEERPAKHPYYQAGIYYLQEPSAMSRPPVWGSSRAIRFWISVPLPAGNQPN